MLPPHRRRSRSAGMFAGNIDPPQDGTAAVVAELQLQLTGEPALRVWQTTGRQLFTGGQLTVQEFVRAPGQPNSEEALEAVPVALNARRTLSRFRGLPGELS